MTPKQIIAKAADALAESVRLILDDNNSIIGTKNAKSWPSHSRKPKFGCRKNCPTVRSTRRSARAQNLASRSTSPTARA